MVIKNIVGSHEDLEKEIEHNFSRTGTNLGVKILCYFKKQ